MPGHRLWPHHWYANDTSKKTEVPEEEGVHQCSRKRLVATIARDVQKLSFPTSKTRCRWQNGGTSTTMFLRLGQIPLLKTVLRMCALGGVFHTTEAATTVNARSGLADGGVEEGALTNAEVTRWHLCISVDRTSVQRSQIDKSCNREERKRGVDMC